MNKDIKAEWSRLGMGAMMRATMLAMLVACAGEVHGQSLRGGVELLSRRDTTVPAPLASGHSGAAQLGPDGKQVLFLSVANNLVSEDRNGLTMDLFLKDTMTGLTTLVDTDPVGGGPRGNVLNAAFDGASGRVLFERTEVEQAGRTAKPNVNIYLRDPVRPVPELISVNLFGKAANGRSTDASISRDGRFVVFQSDAADIASGDVNSSPDVFLRDRLNGVTRRLSKTGTGAPSPGVAGEEMAPSISRDGRFAVFQTGARLAAADGNAFADIYVYDVEKGTNEVVSVNGAGKVGVADCTGPQISEDGRFVIFASDGNLLGEAPGHHLYIRDRVARTTQSIPILPAIPNNPDFSQTAMTPDAAYVFYLNDNQVYRWERAGGTVALASAAPDGTKADGLCHSVAVSEDGRFAVFASNASNLAPNTDTNRFQIYRRDMADGSTRVVSVNPEGQPFKGDAAFPAISGDGSTVVFQAFDGDLVADDRNRATDLFLARAPWNKVEAITTAAIPSLSGGGTSAMPGGLPLSAQWAGKGTGDSGPALLFLSQAPDLVQADGDLFPDVLTGDGTKSELASAPLPGSEFPKRVATDPVISRDGRFAAFSSAARNLVAGATNGVAQVYVRDRTKGETRLASAKYQSADPGAGPSGKPSISADGRFVAFESQSTDLITPPPANANSQIYVRDIQENTTIVASQTVLGVPAAGRSTGPSISPDGRYVVFFNDFVIEGILNRANQLFIRDMQEKTTAPLAARSWVSQMFSADGSTLLYLALPTSISKVSDLYAHELATGKSNIVATGVVALTSVSANGQLAVFTKKDTAGKTDVYVLDRASGATELVSAGLTGAGGNDSSRNGAVSPAGNFVAFESRATDLVRGAPTNRAAQIYVRFRDSGLTFLVSASARGEAGNDNSSRPVISPDGAAIAFQSFASNLVEGDFNETGDIFAAALPQGDSDHDGLPDDWESAHFNGLAQGPNDDPDGDGFTNAQELLADTNPADQASRLQFESARWQEGGGLRLTWKAAVGRSYQVEFKDDLAAPNWSPLPGENDVAGGSAQITDYDKLPTQRFYRLRLAD